MRDISSYSDYLFRYHLSGDVCHNADVNTCFVSNCPRSIISQDSTCHPCLGQDGYECRINSPLSAAKIEGKMNCFSLYMVVFVQWCHGLTQCGDRSSDPVPWWPPHNPGPGTLPSLLSGTNEGCRSRRVKCHGQVPRSTAAAASSGRVRSAATPS